MIINFNLQWGERQADELIIVVKIDQLLPTFTEHLYYLLFMRQGTFLACMFACIAWCKNQHMLGSATIVQLTGMFLVTMINLQHLGVFHQQVKNISLIPQQYFPEKGLTVWMELDKKCLVTFLWH